MTGVSTPPAETTPPPAAPLIEPGGGAHAPVAAPLLVPVAALPADLTASAQPDIVGGGDDAHHDHDDGPPALPVTAAEVATAWTAARHSTRHDDQPGGRLTRLTALAADPTVAASSDANAPRTDPASGGATWAIITAVHDTGGGWWRVEFTLKRTAGGQVGPSSTLATLEVHVANGLVDGERE